MLNVTQSSQSIIKSLEARLQYFQETTLTLGSVCVGLLLVLIYSYRSSSARNKRSLDAHAGGAVELSGGPSRGVQFVERRVHMQPAAPPPPPASGTSTAAAQSLGSAIPVPSDSKRPESIFNLKSGGGSAAGGRWQDRLRTLTLESDSDSSDGAAERVDFRGRRAAGTKGAAPPRKAMGVGKDGGKGESLMNPVHMPMHSSLPANAARTPSSSAASTNYVSLPGWESGSDEELNPFSSHV